MDSKEYAGRGVAFPLNESLMYHIYIHDPAFFVINWVPQTIPGVELLQLSVNKTYHTVFLSLTKHHKGRLQNNTMALSNFVFHFL